MGRNAHGGKLFRFGWWNVTREVDMADHRITNLPNPTDTSDAVNKGWVESQIPKGFWSFMAHVKGSPDSHTLESKSNDVLRITYRKVGNDKQLILSLNNELPNGFYMYDFDIRRSGDTGGCEIYLYGKAGLSGTNSKTLYRFWAKNKNNSGKEFSIGVSSGQGKRFLREKETMFKFTVSLS